MGDEEQTVPPVLQDAITHEIDEWWSHKQQLLDAANAPSTPLYHYTDATGLLGIVKNQEIWFTSIFHLNDSDELSYGLGMVLDILHQISDESNSKIVTSFCDLFERFVTHKYGNLFGFYVASFSRAKDDLGQWRAYTANGKGFALGLAPTLFHVVDKPNRKPHEAVFFSPVVYGKEIVVSRLRELIDRAISIVTRPKNVAAYDGNNRLAFEFFSEVAIHISSPLLWHAITSKHEAYQNEDEMRLIILGGRENLRPYVEVRVRGGEFVPFIRSEMLVQEKGAITELVIGPSAAETTEDGLRVMLELYGIEHESLITHSSIPYRSF